MAARREDLPGVILCSILTMYLLLYRHVGAVTFNTNCKPKDCSQGKRYPGDSYFECSIGMFQEWEEFKTTHDVLESYDQRNTKEMNPPSISAVGFYLIADKRNIKNNPNLNLTFRLPRNSAYDTKALLVKFVGMNDPRYPELIDPYYKDNPRYRLFNFPLYKTPEQDKIHPREILYNCLMGLDCQSEKRVYLITLTAYTLNRVHPGSNITYHFTVYTMRDFTNSSKVTVAMAYIYQWRTMHVVFEPLSAAHVSPYTYYVVKLMEIKTRKLQTVQIAHPKGRYEHEFPDVTKGSYIVEVNVKNCTGLNPCPVSQSGIAEVGYNIVAETSSQTTETSPNAGIYAVTGVVGGVVLLLVLLVCFLVSIDHRPKVYILNLCEEKTHEDVSMALKQCIQKFYDTTVVSAANNNSVKDFSTKSGFQSHHNVIITAKCQHVPIEFVENTKRTLKRAKNVSCICFSQTALGTVPDIESVFMWNQSNGCTEMLKYIGGKQKGHCLSILKQIRPHQKNISENSEEVKHLRRTVNNALTLPVPPPANKPCPVHSFRPDDIQQPLLSKECCHVHADMHYEPEPYTQSFNVPPFPGYFDSQKPDESHWSSLPLRNNPVEGHTFEPRLDHRYPDNMPPISSSDMNKLSLEMMRINGGML